MSKPFEFWRVTFLVEATAPRAASLGEPLTGMTSASELSIFYHLHRRFFRDPERLPEYPNDFAAWADTSLGVAVVAERLANLNRPMEEMYLQDLAHSTEIVLGAGPELQRKCAGA